MSSPNDYPILEVCVDSVESAVSAVRGGANRLEVCGNLGIGGGTTPSLGLLKCIQKAIEIPLMVMIRPRTGDFAYSEEEVNVMLEDIRIFKEAGVCGVVLGVLGADGCIELEATKRLVDEAQPLEVCFHRAFDMTCDAEKALRDIKRIDGITRILTSGQGKRAPEALSTLVALLELNNKCGRKVTVMPGAGINAGSIAEIMSALLPHGLREVHMSGGQWIGGRMVFRRDGMGMGCGGEGDWGVWRTFEDNVRKVRDIMDATV